MTALEKLIREKGITIAVQFGAPRSPEFDGALGYTVTLRYARRQLTVPFYMGPGHGSAEPTASDVLACLCLDATSIENARSFEEWCSDLGFDSNERKAERLYKACETATRKLQRFLGDDYELFCAAEH